MMTRSAALMKLASEHNAIVFDVFVNWDMSLSTLNSCIKLKSVLDYKVLKIHQQNTQHHQELIPAQHIRININDRE